MAYQKYYKRARKYYKKGKKWANTPQTPKALALQALKGLRYVKGMINCEYHLRDISIPLGTQSSITNITAIPQGDGNGQRTGNSILCRSIYIKGFLQINSSVSVNTRLTLVLVRDLQQISDNAPSITDIFTTIQPETLVNTANAGRFKIMWRQTYNLIPNQRPVLNISKYIKTYQHVRYNGSAATDVQKNGMYLLVLTSEATNYPTIGLTSRIGYYDN